ncbi:phosphatidate cytidylyltransferase [Solwaraspora sp. WMMD791]|uniref:phosphatidate cytidylyltransferase n=1 Tax=Solwaraspora sp. WMMD791 TaxID=3016086 RepID=UPI00249A6831|nr:phosphatidate cytidylyltransferase [Solwaraspora sp. WMMD791]WFE27338.1 phosphatidate cytidylyltransferase [Solwaraspora sp. WMMD791]
MSYPETAGGDHPDARTRARRPGAAPESSARQVRNGYPAVERTDPYGRPAGPVAGGAPTYGPTGDTSVYGPVGGVPVYGPAGHTDRAPNGPYTGTGELPHAGPYTGTGVGYVADHRPGGGSLNGTQTAGHDGSRSGGHDRWPPDPSHGQWPPDPSNGQWPPGEPPSPEPSSDEPVPFDDRLATDGPSPSDAETEPESAARRRAGARRRRAGRSTPTRQSRSADGSGQPATAGAAGATAQPAATSGPGTPEPSRAGRNLPAAIGVGVGLGGMVLASLFVWRPAFLAVVVAAVSLGTWEMTRAVRGSGARPPLPPLLAGGVLMAVLAWQVGPDALALGLLLTILAMLVWRLGDGPPGFQRDAATATLIAVYVPFLGGFAGLLASRPDGDLRILVTLAAVILSDTGGYAAGVFFGRHRMAPTISPKKSWEGFAGSVAAAAAGSAVLLYLLLDVMPLWGALFGVAVSIAAVLGDLGESMIKRDLGVKDMSNLLPGHGGLMDRLDSILLALPVSYLVLTLIAPAG